MQQQPQPINAEEIFGVAHWSNGYFAINAQGEVEVHPTQTAQGINMPALINELRKQELRLPVLVRFVDILQDRVHRLYQAFATAKEQQGYQGNYTAAYPIKVNQQASVVEEILRYQQTQVGLECGSKPELMAVLAMQALPGNLIICNGYKDREFVRLALIGQQLGHQVLIIIEQLSEVELILEEAKALNIKPLLGIRVRLSAIGKGNWQNTGGEKAKFGLSSSQLLVAMDMLKKHDALTQLQALHFHMGSQIANIQDIQKGLQEGAQFYVELKKLGANLQFADVGGGLGVDYEGSASRSFFSINYSIAEYAENVLHIFSTVCAQAELPEPHIITEVGRAMTAHHAVLVTEIIDVEEPLSDTVTEELPKDASTQLQELYAIYKQLGHRRLLENYHSVVYGWQEIQSRFNVGSVSLHERALAEKIYVATCRKVSKLLNPNMRAHREVIDELKEKFATKYFANFSLFQSTPDAWALHQVFPVMPLSRLNEPLNEYAVIVDLTCDSDGCIKQYIHDQTTDSCMPFPAYKPDTEILIGIFLVGAYQEILGDMHNLFGDTDAVNVRLTPEGYQIEHIQHGNTIADVLRYVNFDIEKMVYSYKHQIKQTTLSAAVQDQYLNELTAGLQGYTYFED
jgi:arginine decarboxylase